MKQHNFFPGKIDKCQICLSKNLIQVLSLGDQPLANSLLKNDENESDVKKYPLNVVRCENCTLLQIDYIVDQKEVYHPDYPYLPGITKTVDDEQKDLCDFLAKELNLNQKDLIVDIGSNDGSLLKHFKAKGLDVLGVEPTKIAEIANSKGINTIQSFFDEQTAENVIKKKRKAKLITSTNVFAHMSTLGDVMDGIVKLLDDDGYYAFENHYIMTILEKLQYDTFYHEHLRTYSLISLEKLFEQYNLNLFHAQKVSRYGGSIRCIVSKKKQEKSNNLKALIDKEKKLLIDNSYKTYFNFVRDVELSKKELVDKLNYLKSKNKKIIAKSCPARAVVLLNYCGLNNQLLDFVAEQPTSLKLDYFIPGTKIKIINDEILIKENPDYILLLAWHISQPIIDKWKRKGLKSKFIIPLPKVQVV